MTEYNFSTDLENRSEILFVYDARNTNPNGDPLSANNSPRIDRETGQAVVTDVRLKRYIRDELEDTFVGDDSNSVFIMNPSKHGGTSVYRDLAFKNVLGVDDFEDIEEMNGDDILSRFINRAADVRYFGATLSFNEELNTDNGNLPERKGIPSQLIGPVQFSHGHSLNTIVENPESKRLAAVLQSQKGNQTGTFATDNRLKYALITFYGVVNEVGAKNTKLSQEDVERLDKVIWRGLKNQTLTRSKVGQSPRLYLRVEYETDRYYDGDLESLVELGEGAVEDGKIRNVRDAEVNIEPLLDRLDEIREHLEQLHVKTDSQLDYRVGDALDTEDNVLTGRELSNNLTEKFPATLVEPYKDE